MITKEYLDTLKEATLRVERLTAQIREMLSQWRLAPVVTAYQALRGVSLNMEPCEKVALVGPNGAGKSTLILHLNGILQGQGQVQVCSLPVNDKTLGRIRGMVGLVFQNPDDQLFSPTVYDDVAFGPLYQGLPPDEVRARVPELRRRDRAGVGRAHRRGRVGAGRPAGGAGGSDDPVLLPRGTRQRRQPRARPPGAVGRPAAHRRGQGWSRRAHTRRVRNSHWRLPRLRAHR